MPILYTPNKAGFTREEVAEFMRTFPCSGLQEGRAYWFEFDINGNLIDTDCPEQDDGPGALALSQDAWQFIEDGRL